MDAPHSASPQPVPSPATRSAQLALGVFLTLLLGLLALRGYGNSLGIKPTESSRPGATDLNRADRAELEQVPGIGPGLARKIDDHRRAKGPFKSVEELRQVKGIGPATLEKLRAFVRVVESNDPAEELIPEPLVLERRTSSPMSPVAGGVGGSANKLQPGDSPIDVNEADAVELMRIPAVGPVMAQNILNARKERRFVSVEDLDRVKGIGRKTLDKIRPYVEVK